MDSCQDWVTDILAQVGWGHHEAYAVVYHGPASFFKQVGCNHCFLTILRQSYPESSFLPASQVTAHEPLAGELAGQALFYWQLC